ncbi:MAG: aminotransferase class I/II-fold pyridoxal phosphate-dependent enzyme [Desulfobacteraceae bacterium]|nr:aminotransferase class I/II-fold pyridoxal phosphate-dependent enzyme [Desulfobacteraceae bacterium]
MVSDYQKKQHLLLASIKNILPKETKVTQPQGGFLCWLKLPGKIDGLALYKNAINKGLSLTPGEICSPSGRFKNYIRLNYALASADQIESSMKIIAKLIDEQIRKYA